MSENARTALVLLAIGLFALSGSLAIIHKTELDEEMKTNDVDRGIAVVELNNYSKYSGWGADFTFEGRTLIMTGFMLCGRDFLSLIPKGAKDIIVTNFTWFRCSHGNTHAIIRLR